MSYLIFILVCKIWSFITGIIISNTYADVSHILFKFKALRFGTVIAERFNHKTHFLPGKDYK